MLVRTAVSRTMFALLAPLAGVALAQTKAPDVGVALYASADAIAPGQPFDLAVRFDIPDKFHIYWENPGDSGMAPVVNWSGPPGFKFGKLRFPVPTKHETVGLVTNILEGRPVLLTTVTPPADLNVGPPVTIKADVRWLVCQDACFPGAKKLEVVLATADQARPVVDEKAKGAFAAALRDLPKPASEAKYATIKPSVSKTTVAKGDSFEVMLDVAVKSGYHTQSHKPLGEFFIPTELFIKSVAGLEYGKPQWPEPHVRTDSVLGKISEYSGEFHVQIPVKVAAPTLSRDIALAGLLRYQACDNKGRCFPPETVQWSVPLESESLRASAAAAGASETPPSATGGHDEGAGKEVAGTPPLTEEPIVGTASAKGAGGFGAWLAGFGLFGYIVAGFLGGLILNIMPCVLPVISIKILSFVQQGDEDPKRVFRLGLVFSAGIIVSFWVLAAGILILQQATGTARGWGAFFQLPGFVIAMIVVMFVFSLSLFGVFEVVLPGTASSRLAGAADREGATGAFMKGVLATLLATPCTAPLLASAIVYAFTQPRWIVFLMFTVVGVGMASPYILLTARPTWMKHIPKPGSWMVTFKQLMGFLLVGTVVWLLWVLGALLGTSGVVWTVAFLSFVALAAWIYGKAQFRPWSARKALAYATAIFVVVGGGWYANGQYTPEERDQLAALTDTADLDALAASLDWTSDHVPWIPYAKGLAEKLAETGHTVYVDYTAKWCVTCLANKKLVFSSADVRKKMASLGVVPIEADYTRYNPDIAADLNRFGRDAVPLNIILPADKPDRPIELPVVLTPGIVLDGLEQAGPSRALVVAQSQAQLAATVAGE